MREGAVSPMPLTTCDDCGHQVSVRATSCPNCGAPRTPSEGSSGRLPVGPPPETPPVAKPAPRAVTRIPESTPIVRTPFKIAGAAVGGLFVLLLVIALIASAVGGSRSRKSAAAVAGATHGSHIFLVASRSWCAPTGVDDVYSGDGHVTFFLTFKNSGDEKGTTNAVPVRHYDDGTENESALDEVSVDVGPGEVWRGRTEALTYKAHSHEINSCGVIVDGRDEVSIRVG
jgi:hypothetical protein